MTVHAHFLIIWGQWKLENWHLYRLCPHRNRSGKCQWEQWDKVI